MDEPLGRTVGNALELAEAIDVLHGQGPADVVNLVLDLATKVANARRAQLQNGCKMAAPGRSLFL